MTLPPRRFRPLACLLATALLALSSAPLAAAPGAPGAIVPRLSSPKVKLFQGCRVRGSWFIPAGAG